jgi:hypothetical protein
MQETEVNAVEQLQETVEALERRINDLTLKAQITSSQLVGRTGLDRFFGEREFWENIIDVGASECHARCVRDLQAEYAAIAANTEYSDVQRQAAYNDALHRASECHNACDERFPIPIE